MTPEYLEELADLADPDQLWRFRPRSPLNLPADKRHQLDMGIALRRYAHHLKELALAQQKGKSLLITKLSPNSFASMMVDAPDNHKRLARYEQHSSASD